MNKEWLIRSLFPLIGLGCTLLLWAGFTQYLKPLIAELFRNAPDVGFKEVPVFAIAAVNPLVLPLSALILCGLFVCAAFTNPPLLRTVLTALGYVFLVLFAIFWTMACAGMANLIQTIQRPPMNGL